MTSAPALVPPLRRGPPKRAAKPLRCPLHLDAQGKLLESVSCCNTTCSTTARPHGLVFGSPDPPTACSRRRACMPVCAAGAPKPSASLSVSSIPWLASWAPSAAYPQLPRTVPRAGVDSVILAWQASVAISTREADRAPRCFSSPWLHGQIVVCTWRPAMSSSQSSPTQRIRLSTCAPRLRRVRRSA